MVPGDKAVALAHQARDGLSKLNLSHQRKRTDLAFIDSLEDENDVGTLRIIAAYAGVYRPEVIMGTSLYVSLAEITSDHLWVYTELDRAYEGNVFGAKKEQRVLDEFASVMVHALLNIKDGRFIVSLVKDRGIVRMDDIMDVLPVLKVNGVNVLVEGNL